MNVQFERVNLSGLMALAGFVVIGCGTNSDAPAETNDPVFLQAVHDETAAQQGGASIARLVDQYLFHPASPEEMASIRTRVRELQGEELEQFYHTVLERSEATEGQRTLIKQSLAHSKATGVSFVDFSDEDVEQILSRASGVPIEEVRGETGDLQKREGEPGRTQRAACPIGYAECSYTTAWNSAVGQTICDPGDNCSPADYWDNVGNSDCELISCDTRLRFPVSSGQYIDGVTTAADCVIGWYGSLAKYSSGGNTFVGYGIAGPAACLFFAANPAAHFYLK